MKRATAMIVTEVRREVITLTPAGVGLTRAECRAESDEHRGNGVEFTCSLTDAPVVGQPIMVELVWNTNKADWTTEEAPNAPDREAPS